MITRLLFAFALALMLASSSWAQSFYQAESAQLAGGVTAGSGNGVGYAEYLTTRNASSVIFSSVTVAESKTYALDFRYSAALAGARSLSVYVNDVDVAQVLFPSTGGWSTWATQSLAVRLQANVANKITLRYDADDNGWINLDYLQVNPEPLSAGFRPGSALTASWFPSEISVDKFTGTAQLYVPLHTVEAIGISLPVGLAYAATGVRVDDLGSEAGVNWSLAGGVSISREVRGLPDDKQELSATENRYGWLVYPGNGARYTAPGGAIAAVPNASAAFLAASCAGDEVTALQELNYIGNLLPVV